MKAFLLFLPAMATVSASAATESGSPCQGVEASAAVYRLAELPPEIREDLAKFSNNRMADAGAEIRRTDAPTEAELKLPTSALLHGLLVGEEWFVSFDAGEFGIRTFGYVRGSDGRYFRAPWHFFGGPACVSVRAALDGVTSPGGYDF